MPDPLPIIDPLEDEHDHDHASESTALCLSGGGYRAMLFHLGALWRLNQLGMLRNLGCVSSVSGGSITAGVLGLNWGRLRFDDGVAENFVDLVVEPVHRLADRRLDVANILKGVFGPGTVAEKVADAYDKHLFKGATLQDLPDDRAGAPRFVINATNVQSGALWRFSRRYMGDWRVGRVHHPTLRLADAVAASSAFPPVLSPLKLKLDPETFTDDEGNDLGTREFRRKVVLTDGGVYDNMGLETAWKRHPTVFVSDGGGKMGAEEDPKVDWAQHSVRILGVIDNQVRSLRKRQIIHAFKTDPARNGVYWGIRTDIANYDVPCLDCPHPHTLALADTKTRLTRIETERQQQLVNWGYAVADAALRRHVAAAGGANVGEFPYPAAGVSG